MAITVDEKFYNKIRSGDAKERELIEFLECSNFFDNPEHGELLVKYIVQKFGFQIAKKRTRMLRREKLNLASKIRSVSLCRLCGYWF